LINENHTSKEMMFKIEETVYGSKVQSFMNFFYPEFMLFEQMK